jgi:hypothetical protein
MSGGLYTMAHVARYLRKKPREMDSLINDHCLPVVAIPAEKGPVAKITLHGLHDWLSRSAKGAAFMPVEHLAAELELCAEVNEEAPNEEEISLLNEMGIFAEQAKLCLKVGNQPKHLRAALSTVVDRWKELQTKEAA